MPSTTEWGPTTAACRSGLLENRSEVGSDRDPPGDDHPRGWSSPDNVLQPDGRIKEEVRGQIEEAIGEAMSRDTETEEQQEEPEGEEGGGTDEEEEEDDQMSESGDESETEGEDESESESDEQKKERVDYVKAETERRSDQRWGGGGDKRTKQQRNKGVVETEAGKEAKHRAQKKRDIYKATKGWLYDDGKELQVAGSELTAEGVKRVSEWKLRTAGTRGRRTAVALCVCGGACPA
jgi:hypothetical protein